MPRRRVPFVNGQTYHIFNRSLHKHKIFQTDYWCNQAIQRIWFYHFAKQNLKFSRYRILKPVNKIALHNAITDSKIAVKIHSYTLMPNHFHLLVTQLEDGGIQNLVSNFQSSFSQFKNAIEGKTGSLFEQQFQAILIESDEIF